MQDILDGCDTLSREASTNTLSIIPTSGPTDVQCNMDNRKNFVIVVDQSESFGDRTCQEMNEFLLNLVSQLLDENESRVSIIEYGANVVINFDEVSVGANNKRTLVLNELEREVDYCDNSATDENHYCKEEIDLGEDEIFLRDNIVTDPNSSPTFPNENYLIVFQNSDCNDHEDACKNGTFKEKLESVNVKSYVFNFGPNAVKNES